MAPRRRKTILLIDDDAGVLTSLAMCLSKAKFNVIEASSGEEALQAYERHRDEIDLVLTDIVMPGLFGDQVAMLLWKRDPNLPVVFLSGYPPETLAPGITIELGKNFLPKPFVLDELMEMVHKQLAPLSH